MKRSLIAIGGLLLAAWLPATASAAAPRVGPPLQAYATVDGVDATTATLTITGTGCVPLDAPASVLLTIDKFPDKVFTATPNEKGRWSVDVEIPYPIDVEYVINAECDNYFGATVYPELRVNGDNLVIAVPVDSTAGGGAHGNPGGVANTGPRTGAEVGIGLAALALGTLLVWAGRPRRRAAGA